MKSSPANQISPSPKRRTIVTIESGDRVTSTRVTFPSRPMRTTLFLPVVPQTVPSGPSTQSRTRITGSSNAKVRTGHRTGAGWR